MALPFAEVHLKLINTSASDWTSALADLRMRFPRDDIVSTLQTRVHAFLDLSRALLPVTDPAVDAEHWRVLFAALGPCGWGSKMGRNIIGCHKPPTQKKKRIREEGGLILVIARDVYLRTRHSFISGSRNGLILGSRSGI